jgi:hypothetical protein
LTAIAACVGPGGFDEARGRSALGGRFETVFRSKADLLAAHGGFGKVRGDAVGSLQLPFANLIASVKPGILRAALSVMVGAKDFRSPVGLGAVGSTWCYLVVPRSRDDVLARYIDGRKVDSSAGRVIWSWSRRLGEYGEGDPRASVLYAVESPGKYLLVSNDESELLALDAALGRPAASGGSDPLTQWQMAVGQDYWGYRRYRNVGVADRSAAGLLDVAPTAETLGFVARTGTGHGIVRFSSTSPDDRTIERMAPRILTFRRTDRLSWEADVSLSGDARSVEQLFAVIGLLGFGIYL